MPQIGSNIYAIGMITALRDYVRLLRAIPMLTLSSHHQHHPSLLRTVPFLSSLFSILSSLSLSLSVILCSVLHDLPYKRQIRVIKRPVARHAHCSRRPCNFRFDVLPVLFADRLPIRPSRLFNLSADFCGEIVAVPVYESRMIFYKYVRLEFFDRSNLCKIL